MRRLKNHTGANKAWESDGLGVSQFIFIFRVRHRIRLSYFLVLAAPPHERSLKNMINLKSIIRLSTFIIGLSCAFSITSCSMYSSELAGVEPRLIHVKTGSVIQLKRGEPIYIKNISNKGVTAGTKDGDGWILAGDKGSANVGNNEHLRVIEFNADSGKAIIRHSATDRRGFGGAFAF